MTGASRRAEFFALEASEYLADLEPAAARADTPDLERLVRGARALRGAALMAGLGTFARAAAGLEAVARQVRDHALGWEPHARSGWREGLQTLRGLVARATQWEAADDRHALALADRLERIANGRSAEAPAPEPTTPVPSGGLTPGVRAFIARESGLIADTLLEASRALAPLPPAGALAAVLERMRSLRGVGSAGELSPLPELLDAMEATTRSLLNAAGPPPPAVAGVFADAADALASMARSVAQEGRVVVPPGLDEVAGRLLRAFTDESDVVAIDALAVDGATALTSQAPTRRAEPVPLELVGVGDHLLLQADAFEHHPTPAARDLRLFVMHRSLATMPVRSGTGEFIAPLARAISRVIADGHATSAPDQFTALLRRVGTFLLEAGNRRDRDTRAAERDALVHAIGGEAPPPAAPVTSATPRLLAEAPAATAVAVAPEVPTEATEIIDIDALAPDDVVVPIADLAPDLDDEQDVVDIATLGLEDPATDDVIPIAALAPDSVPGDTGAGRLERAYRRLAELQAGVPAPSAASGEEPVEIDHLLYRGGRALARADEVRRELSGILAEPTVSLERLRPLLDELLDLVPLARDAA